MNAPPDLSIVICSAERPVSLGTTLEHIAAAEDDGRRIEVVVVNNGGREDIRAVADVWAERLPLRHVVEMRPGKPYALNAALDAGGLAPIVAFLDDDMSPRPEWVRDVLATCDRWPDCDLFGGRGAVIWPTESVPGWARDPRVRGWAYSVLVVGPQQDRQLPPGHFPSGNNFWMRGRALETGTRFREVWATEADLVLRLMVRGQRCVISSGAVADHRVQPELLDPAVIRRRAARFGRARAQLELAASPDSRQMRLYRRSRLAARLLWLTRLLGSSLAYLASFRPAAPDTRFARRLDAVVRVAMNWEKLTRACVPTSGSADSLNVP